MKMPKIKISHQRMRKILITLLILLACFGLGYFVTDLIISYFSWDLPWYTKIARSIEILLILAFSYVIHVFFHEAGHMVAALIRGWHFLSFLFFRKVVYWREGKLHVASMHIPGVLGQCMMMPPEEGDSQKGVILYNAGGLIANAVLVLLAVIGLIAAPVTVAFEWLALYWSLIISGIFLMVVNGFTSQNYSLPNDGTNIKFMMADPRAVELFLQCLRYQGWMQQGKPLNEVAHGYFFDLNQETPDVKNTIHLCALSMDVDLAMSKFDFAKAKEYLNFIEKKHRGIYPLYWKLFRANIMYLHLLNGEDCSPDIWNYEMDQFLNKLADSEPMAMRIQYMIAKFYDHNEKRAESLYRKFNTLCDHYYLPGNALTERKLVDFARLR